MPIRTCLVTGKKGEPSQFFRFTIIDGELIFDVDAKNLGRGGYVIKEVQALDRLPHLIKKVVHFMKVTGSLKIEKEVIEKQKGRITN